MDKKKKVIMQRFQVVCMFLAAVFSLYAQDVKQIQFCDKYYGYGTGRDSVTLFLKVLDSDGNRSDEVTADDLEKYLVVNEEGKLISNDRRKIISLNSGHRIPRDYTFSVLVDLTIPTEGKSQIYDVVEKLVESASDSCVYLSFFGDKVTSSMLATKQNYKEFKPLFLEDAENKHFYSA